MKITYYRHRNTKVIKLEGDLERVDLESFDSVTQSIFKNEKIAGFDLSHASFVNSTIIATLVSVYKKHKVKVIIYVGGNKSVLETLGVVGLTKVFTVLNDYSAFEKHCL